MEQKEKVKFIRKNGRVIPIKPEDYQKGKSNKVGAKKLNKSDYAKGNKARGEWEKLSNQYYSGKGMREEVSKFSASKAITAGAIGAGVGFLVGGKKGALISGAILAGLNSRKKKWVNTKKGDATEKKMNAAYKKMNKYGAGF